jgi:hypothetical protein
MKTEISKDQWVAMFREIGLDDSKMHLWHHIFETRHPVGHESFLNWLGLSTEEIEGIRAESRE